MRNIRDFINKNSIMNESLSIKEFNNDEIAWTMDDFLEDHPELIEDMNDDPKAKNYVELLKKSITNKNAGIVFMTLGDDDENEYDNPEFEKIDKYIMRNKKTCKHIFYTSGAGYCEYDLYLINNGSFIAIRYEDQAGAFYLVPKTGKIE